MKSHLFGLLAVLFVSVSVSTANAEPTATGDLGLVEKAPSAEGPIQDEGREQTEQME